MKIKLDDTETMDVLRQGLVGAGILAKEDAAIADINLYRSHDHALRLTVKLPNESKIPAQANAV